MERTQQLWLSLAAAVGKEAMVVRSTVDDVQSKHDCHELECVNTVYGAFWLATKPIVYSTATFINIHTMSLSHHTYFYTYGYMCMHYTETTG